MITVVAAVIERSDRRLLIGQRRRNDTSPLKWEFPGGKVRRGESPETALERELQEELGVMLVKSTEIGRVRLRGSPGSCQKSLEITIFWPRIANLLRSLLPDASSPQKSSKVLKKRAQARATPQTDSHS